MKPSHRLFQIAVAMCFVAIAMAMMAPLGLIDRDIYVELILPGFWLVCVVLIAIAVCDAVYLQFVKPFDIQRDIPKNLSHHRRQKVTLAFENQLQRSMSIELYDHHPSSMLVDSMPLTMQLRPGQRNAVSYDILPSARGNAKFDKVEVWLRSLLGLWQKKQFYAVEDSVRVFPDFASISDLSAMNFEQQSQQLGIQKIKRRGEGLEFQQLREWREGDSMRQIDWKASSRRNKLISREYQDEKDQQVIYMLDSGKRMHTKEGNYSHFDIALNAVLLSAYVALKAGDAVGMQAFGGSERMVPPVKGGHAINALMRSVYDLQSAAQVSDFSSAAMALMAEHRKRSLVVIVSNVVTEDRDDLLAAIELLKSKHKVMLASLREPGLDESLEQPVEDFESANRFTAAIQLDAEREIFIRQLKANGVIVVDCMPMQLHHVLVNEYLQLKRSQLL